LKNYFVFLLLFLGGVSGGHRRVLAAPAEEPGGRGQGGGLCREGGCRGPAVGGGVGEGRCCRLFRPRRRHGDQAPGDGPSQVLEDERRDQAVGDSRSFTGRAGLPYEADC